MGLPKIDPTCWRSRDRHGKDVGLLHRQHEIESQNTGDELSACWEAVEEDDDAYGVREDGHPVLEGER